MLSTSTYGLGVEPEYQAAARFWMNYVHENVRNVYFNPEDVPQGTFVWSYPVV